MICVSVLYPNTGDFDMDYYLSNHMALVHKLLDPIGLVRTEVDQGIGTAEPNAPAPYIAIGHMVFDTLENMQKALQEHDPALAADVPNFTEIQPIFQISKML